MHFLIQVYMISISIHKVWLAWYSAATMWYLAAWYCIGRPKQLWTVRIWTADTIKDPLGLVRWGPLLPPWLQTIPWMLNWTGRPGKLGGQVNVWHCYTWIIMFREDAWQQHDHVYSMYNIDNLSTFNQPSEFLASWIHIFIYAVMTEDFCLVSAICQWHSQNYKPSMIVPNNPRNQKSGSIFRQKFKAKSGDLQTGFPRQSVSWSEIQAGFQVIFKKQSNAYDWQTGFKRAQATIQVRSREVKTLEYHLNEGTISQPLEGKGTA